MSIKMSKCNKNNNLENIPKTWNWKIFQNLLKIKG